MHGTGPAGLTQGWSVTNGAYVIAKICIVEIRMTATMPLHLKEPKKVIWQYARGLSGQAGMLY